MGIDMDLYVDGTVTDEEFETGREEWVFRLGHDARLIRSDWADTKGRVGTDQGYVRYWGPGYERGPWEQIAGWIEGLRAAFPNHTIMYGGDSGFAEPVTDELMAEYWAHWRSPKAHAYRDSFK